MKTGLSRLVAEKLKNIWFVIKMGIAVAWEGFRGLLPFSKPK